MSPKYKIQEGALIISDAHYSKNRPQLLDFLKTIQEDKIQTSQLLLMGDIFDALFGSIDYTYRENEELIALLESLAQTKEILYLEGNHDFNLRAVFSNITIFPIARQPVICDFKGKQVCLAHGDFDGKTGYKIYTALIRNKFVLKILKPIDTFFNHFILNYVYKHLMKKDDCKELVWFESLIKQRFSSKRFGCDYFIEGHFHQNRSYSFKSLSYTNLAAFACNQRYFRVKSTKDNGLSLEEQQFIAGEKHYG